MAMQEHLDQSGAKVEQNEFDNLAPADDYQYVFCKLCKKTLHKESVNHHFTNLKGPHKLTETVVKQWQGVKDGRAIGNGRLTKCILSLCYHRFMKEAGLEGDADASVEAGGGKCGVCGVGAFAPPTPKHPPTLPPKALSPGTSLLASDACAALARIEAHVQPKTVNVVLQNLGLKECIKAWLPPRNAATLRRIKYPFKFDKIMCNLFQAYLRTVVDDEGTVEGHILNLQRSCGPQVHMNMKDCIYL